MGISFQENQEVYVIRDNYTIFKGVFKYSAVFKCVVLNESQLFEDIFLGDIFPTKDEAVTALKKKYLYSIHSMVTQISIIHLRINASFQREKERFQRELDALQREKERFQRELDAL